jgi:hypothetical protein
LFIIIVLVGVFSFIVIVCIFGYLIGCLWMYALGMMTASPGILFLALICHIGQVFRLILVEIPHMRRLYGKSAVNEDSGLWHGFLQVIGIRPKAGSDKWARPKSKNK